MTKGVHTTRQCKATLDASMERLDYEREKIKSRMIAMKLADKHRFIQGDYYNGNGICTQFR